MMKILRIVAALLALCAPAAAQVVQLQPGQVLGNSTAARALAQPASISAMLDRALTGGTAQGAVATRNASAWIALAPGTAGLPLLSGGAGANLGYAILGLSAGGTNANLTASNGGIFYSTGSAAAILAGTATAGQIPLSGASSAPSWSTTTYPATAPAGSLLNASALNVIGATLTPVIGASGTLGTLGFGNATSGTITLQPVAGALGSAVLTMPAATDTIAVLAASQAFTNKTYNGNTWTAGTGTLTIAAGKTLTGNSSLTLAGVDAKTLTVNNSLTLSGTDAKALVLTNGLTVSGNDGTLSFGAASKTLTVNNSIGLTGTDAAVYTFPNATSTIPRVVASGAKALATSAISSAACSSAQTDTATGTLTTDAIIASFNADPTAVTGYVALTSGMLTIFVYPTADTVNFKVCNQTAASITPGAVTINWRVVR